MSSPRRCLWVYCWELEACWLWRWLRLLNWLRDGQEKLVLIWLISNLLALYVPVVLYRGRFTLGLIVPTLAQLSGRWMKRPFPLANLRSSNHGYPVHLRRTQSSGSLFLLPC
ncbi:MAG: hypothetical protein IPM76_25145 [Chloroflexi bacterium]|nr:hypothetical protein [Chloroflexota bacterium]